VSRSIVTRNRALVAVGILLVALPGCTTNAPGTTATSGLLFEHLAGLPHVVYVPRDYSPDKAWPCIVFLHGSGESGTDGQKQIAQGIGTNILWNADRWPAIVLMPQKPAREVLWNKHADAIMAALAQVRSRYSIDPDRISLTGLSQGGHGVWTIAAAHPEVWSALVPICGFVDSNRATNDPAAIASRIKHIPVWAFHGDADDVVPPQQTVKMIDALRAAGAEPRLTIYPGVNHGSWDRAYAEPELPEFLTRARRR
jgi:predicted peptidase